MSSGRLKGVWNIVSVNNQATSADHSHLIAFGGEFLLIGLFALIASASDDAAKVILALLVVMWLVYVTFNIDLIQRFFDAITSAAKVP